MKKLKINYMYNLIFQVLVLIIPMIVTPYITRILGAKSLGMFSFVNANINYFTLVANLGFGLYCQNKIAKIKNNLAKMNYFFTNTLILRILISFVSYVTFIIFYFIFVKEYKLLYLILSFQIIASVLDISWLYMGLEEFKMLAIRNLIVKLVCTTFIFLLVHKQSDIYIYALISVLGIVISNIVLWKNIYKYFSLKSIDKGKIISIFLGSFLLFIPTISTSIYTDFIRTFLGITSSNENVAYYVQADMLVKVVLGLVTSLGVVMMPHMSDLFSKGEESKAKLSIMLSFEAITIIAIPLVFGTIAISNNFIYLFLGKNFMPTSILLQIGIISIIFSGWNNVLGVQYMLPYGKVKQYTLCITLPSLSIFFIAPLMYFLVGISGVMVSIIIVTFLIFFLEVLYCKNDLIISKVFPTILKSILSGLIMLVSIIYFNNIIELSKILMLLLDITFGSFVYAFCCYLFNITIFVKFIEQILKNVVIKQSRGGK